MTTKRASLFGFFIKTLVVVSVLVAVTIIGLNMVSRRTLKEAQATFETVAQQQAKISGSWSRTHLKAAARAASDLNFEADEKKWIGDLATRPLGEWTTQDDALVALVADRNRSALESIARALTSNPSEYSEYFEPPLESRSDDHLDSSPIEIHLRLILVARIFAAEGRLSIRTGHGAYSTERLMPLNYLAEGLQSQAHFLDVLMGSAIERILNSCLLEVVSSDTTTFNMVRKDLASLVPELNLMEALRSALTEEVTLWVRAVDEAKSDENLQGIFIAPIVGPILKRFLQAAFLDVGTRLLGLIDTPFGSDTGTFTSPPEPPRWNVIRRVAWIAQPNMLNMIGRSQATAAQRQLLDAALTMRMTPWPDGPYPETRPDLPALSQPDPFSGQLLEYRLLDDGRLHLAVAGGPELLKALKMPGLHTWLDPVILEAPAPEESLDTEE